MRRFCVSGLVRVGIETRKQVDKEEKTRLQKDLSQNPKLVFHFDGKRYDERGNYVERVPMLLSGFPNDEEHLLEIPIVDDGKAVTLAEKVGEAHSGF